MTLFASLASFASPAVRMSWAPGDIDVNSNGFLLIVGGSGSGKTTVIRQILGGMDAAGMPSLNIDFHGDMADGRRVESVVLSGGMVSTIGINPLDIDPLVVEMTGLREAVSDLRDVIRSRISSIGHNQSPMLADYLMETYARAGIVEGDPASWSKPAPQLADVLKTMSDSEDKEARGLINMVRDIFGHAIFNKRSYLSAASLIARPLHINMKAIGSDAVKGVAVDTILRGMMRALRARGHIKEGDVNGSDKARFRTFLVVDEARHAGTTTMDTVFLEMRKFGLGAVLAAQMVEHFSPEVRGNAASWLVLKHNTAAEAAKTGKELKIDPDRIMALEGRGHGLFRQGNGPWLQVR